MQRLAHDGVYMVGSTASLADLFLERLDIAFYALNCGLEGLRLQTHQHLVFLLCIFRDGVRGGEVGWGGSRKCLRSIARWKRGIRQ